MSNVYRVALLAEKAPYLLTLFVAACGWLVTYTVGRYEKAPLVEYSTKSDVSGVGGSAAKSFTTTVRNISPGGLIACVRLLFVARDKSGIEVPLRNQELVRLSGPMTDVIFTDREKAVVFQMDLHPAAAVELPVSATVSAALTTTLAQCELPTGQPVAGPLPVLMETSLKTSLIRNSLEVLWIGAFALAVALCWIYLSLGGTAATHPAAARSDHMGREGSPAKSDTGSSSRSSGGIYP